MAIRSVFFDMGGTIETFSFTRESRLQATPEISRRLQSVGVELNLNNEHLFEVVSQGLESYHQWSLKSLEELPAARVWQEFILADYDVDPAAVSAVSEDLMLWVETRYYDRMLRPEVPGVLEAIQRMGLGIGLISNVCSRGQVPTSLDRYGIRRYFNPVVLSSEYGRRKPDPAIFHYAARLANVPTGKSLYVGDRIARDVVGAHRAGFGLAIQIRHDFDDGEEDTGDTPDAVIGQMTELLDILRAEQDRSISQTASRRTSHRGISAFFFDAEGILYYRRDRRRRLKAFLRDLGLDPDEIPLDKMEALRHQACRGLIGQDECREAILRLYGVTEPEHIERGMRIMDEEDNRVIFFKGVRETLNSLKGMGYMLGVITDSAFPVHVKIGWFERGGFGHVWDSIVSSNELGIRKPDPGIFQASLKQLGLPSDQAVFVGHKASELDGARVAGMRTIALKCEEPVAADFHVDKFSDLLRVPLVAQSTND